jgi:hypothetical protein
MRIFAVEDPDPPLTPLSQCAEEWKVNGFSHRRDFFLSGAGVSAGLLLPELWIPRGDVQIADVHPEGAGNGDHPRRLWQPAPPELNIADLARGHAIPGESGEIHLGPAAPIALVAHEPP